MIRYIQYTHTHSDEIFKEIIEGNIHCIPNAVSIDIKRKIVNFDGVKKDGGCCELMYGQEYVFECSIFSDKVYSMICKLELSEQEYAELAEQYKEYL